eukprot:m.156763 g.156763  ORF g.156763 m.156763 type:complete len:645 (-) comp16996_c0_seq4:512-2446(-)
MKFEEYLSRHAVPEWASRYVNYKLLKDTIDDLVKFFPQPIRTAEDVATFGEAMRSHTLFRKFFVSLEDELDKVDRFFAEQEQAAAKRFEELRQSVLLFVNSSSRNQLAQLALFGVQKSFMQRLRSKLTLQPSERVVLMEAFEEYYRLLDMIRVFRDLNVTGFRKAIKKFDKNTGLTQLDSVMEQVRHTHMMRSETLNKLVSSAEKLYIDVLMQGDRRRAMRRLRLPEARFEPIDWQTVRLGVYFGVVLLTVPILIITSLLVPREDYPALSVVFKMYRGLLMPIVLVALLGVNVYNWQKYSVNHIFIMSLNVRKRIDYKDLVEIGGFMAVLWCAFVLVYVFRKHVDVSEFMGPIALLSIFAGFLFLPVDILAFKARKWLLGVLWRICAAPFYEVKFEDFWLADQLMSLTLFLLDLQFFFCACGHNFEAGVPVCEGVAYGVRPIMTSLPAWFRFAQCLRRYRDTRKAFPHLVNAGKYASVFCVVLFSSLSTQEKQDNLKASFSAYVVLWAVSAAINTIYSGLWDVKMDFGLLAKKTDYPFLRKELLYPVWFYYFAIVNNVICRLAWTISISVGFFNVWFNDGLVAMLAAVELYRRFIWNFLRLENEHLNNAGEFRAVREIPLPYEYLASDELAFGDEDYKHAGTMR